MKYSLIIPVFNRPDEVDELLQSLTQQTVSDMEVVVVEDGSFVTCEHVVKRYAKLLDVKYFKKKNSGPGPTRNYGAEHSQGQYLIILDSDCVLPPGYLEAVERELKAQPCDVFGGPDRAHSSFTPVQKAINYSMTSFFTTGGIRGGKKKMDKFYPRSFNMGVRATLFRQLGGFSKMRFGEDIDFSLRIFARGASCRLFPEAWVWHKRRTDMKKFWRQVFNSGMARINLYLLHPHSLKMVHLLPMVFTVGMAMLVAMLVAGTVLCAAGCSLWGTAMICASLLPPLIFSLLILTDSAVRNRSLKVGLLSVAASYVQLLGYGCGFIQAWWQRLVQGSKEEAQAFRETFYK